MLFLDWELGTTLPSSMVLFFLLSHCGRFHVCRVISKKWWCLWEVFSYDDVWFLKFFSYGYFSDLLCTSHEDSLCFFSRRFIKVFVHGPRSSSLIFVNGLRYSLRFLFCPRWMHSYFSTIGSKKTLIFPSVLVSLLEVKWPYKFGPFPRFSVLPTDLFVPMLRPRWHDKCSSVGRLQVLQLCSFWRLLCDVFNVAPVCRQAFFFVHLLFNNIEWMFTLCLNMW